MGGGGVLAGYKDRFRHNSRSKRDGECVCMQSLSWPDVCECKLMTCTRRIWVFCVPLGQNRTLLRNVSTGSCIAIVCYKASWVVDHDGDVLACARNKFLRTSRSHQEKLQRFEGALAPKENRILSPFEKSFWNLCNNQYLCGLVVRPKWLEYKPLQPY